MGKGASSYARWRNSLGTNSSRRTPAIAASTPESWTPRRRNCFSIISALDTANSSSFEPSRGGSLDASCRRNFIVLLPDPSSCYLLLWLRINLLQEFTHGCVNLNVMPSIAFADGTRYGHVHGPGVHLHRRSIRRGDLDEWNAQS